ncbi:hypothetical protein E4U42_006755 [Claviceps africana]|uniref:Uncharacterized protein n=1 Tax=Claviceps africana TaxID=83212 RepID=A0A8K0NEV0_9HYPO|nr:hypothetical protein E4U42_006755 [Claviceps africana]
MSLFTAQLHPGRALGFLILGASLHDVLTRLKAEPQRFPKLEVVYSPEQPVTEPVCVVLPQNGIRLRFDGPEQRLRLIEVVDFTKSHITFKDRDLVKPPANGTHRAGSPVAGESPLGPTFRHIYHRVLGPTYAGEFLAPPAGSPDDGTYVLSYPGVAFNFSLANSAYSADKDVVTLLSPPASPNRVATSMAVFSGTSWAEARQTLWTDVLPSVKQTSVLPRTKDVYPDEVSLVRIHGGGRLDLFRKWTKHAFRIQLGETTPQELVMELGPPNAIYRKNEQKMIIHKMRTTSNAHGWTSAGAGAGAGAGGAGTGDPNRPEDLIDTDQSSMNTGSDDSGNDEAVDDQQTDGINASGECFYNYFYLGFDILLSPATPPSEEPPASRGNAGPLPTPLDAAENPIKNHQPDLLVATKLVLHGNVPGSYEFNRHRRCRWDISYLEQEQEEEEDGDDGEDDHQDDHQDREAAPHRSVTSETPFGEIERRMKNKWKSTYPAGQKLQQQRGMVLNRGWGDSPGSSCEFLGGWEESGARRAVTNGDSTTTLYGFPGLVFEVLRNDHVNTVTVF